MARRYVLVSVVVMFLVAGLLAACGGGGESAPTPLAKPLLFPPPTQIPALIPISAPVPTAVPTPMPAPTAPSASLTSARVTNVDSDEMELDLFELGEHIYLEDASEGVGCAYCHGKDGRGNIGPNIRGKMPGDILFALESVDAMEFLRMNQKKIEAVSEYLKWLTTQP